MPRAKVTILRTKPESVLADYGRLMELAEYNKHLPSDATVMLKDNISWHFPYLSANTTPWQLEGVVKKLRADGYRDLVCVQNRTVVTNAEKGERLNKFSPILKENGIPALFNFRPDHMKWVVIEPKQPMLALHKIFPEGIRVPDYFFGRSVLHLPTVKCHIYTTTTGAMKNAFGGLLNTRRHYTHTWIHETLVDLLAIQKQIHRGIFCVMDGTIAGDGPGPRTMRPVEKDVILASDDQVAVDAVAAKLMGFDPMSIGFIRMAHERGLGVGRLEEIDLAGDVDAAKESWGFSVGDNLASHVGDLLWFSPLKVLQKLFFHTPLVNLFVFGSFFYHDYYWWPVKGKKRMDEFQRQKRWGQLFSRYPI